MTKKHLQLKSTVVLFIFILASSLSAQTGGTKDPLVTPVQGESWLKQLHRPFNATSMGNSWDLGPPAPMPGEDSPQWQLDLTPRSGTESVTLHGSDLYRLNCQGCHGSSGTGAPPEINSVINPVQATSTEVTLERSKKTGQDLSRATASEFAKQAKVLLLQRIHKGGQSMPPFAHLSEAEITSLVAYLEQLAEVPGADRKQIAIKESNYRVGEQIVKSTCHICHSAVGPNPTPQQLMGGAIPPLSTLLRRTSLSDFVRKVTHGAPVVMGEPRISYRDLYRGKMPVFVYLSQEEAADAYMYLTAYPPRK